MKNGKELLIIILVSIAVRLPWLIMIPQAEAPDENMHRWVINYIAHNCHLPDHRAIENGGLESAYCSVPPFGYLPHIVLLKLFSFDSASILRQFFTRLGSLLMSLVVVIAAYWVGRRLFTDNHLASLAVPLLIVFHPQFVFVSAYANNDMTTAALSSLILLNLISILDKGLGTIRIVLLAFLLSWLILSKYSGLHLFPIACLFLCITAYIHKHKVTVWLRQGTVFFVLMILMTAWWFIRNYWQFNGDILGLKTMNHLWKIVYHTYSGPPSSIQAILFSSSFWRMLFFSFWGWFGYMTHSLPRFIYYGYLAFVLLSGGVGISYWRTIGSPKAIPTKTWIWFLFAICLVSNLLMCAYCCCAQVSGPQGRYLFPSEIAIMSLLIAGLHSMTKQWSNKLIWAMLIFNFTAYCYSTYYLYRLYCQT